jgi:hypothetical protein
MAFIKQILYESKNLLLLRLFLPSSHSYALHCQFVSCCYKQVFAVIHISITSAEKDRVLEASCILPENQTECPGVQTLGPTFAMNSCLSLT